MNGNIFYMDWEVSLIEWLQKNLGDAGIAVSKALSTIGGETIYFEGVSDGGIIVDSELMDALSYDGTALANDKISGQPWLLQPGSLTVSWDFDPDGVDEATGDLLNNSVTSVEILPRWRWH